MSISFYDVCLNLVLLWVKMDEKKKREEERLRRKNGEKKKRKEEKGIRGKGVSGVQIMGWLVG